MAIAIALSPLCVGRVGQEVTFGIRFGTDDGLTWTDGSSISAVIEALDKVDQRRG